LNHSGTVFGPVAQAMGICLAVVLAASLSHAQNTWPDKPIHFVVPFTPGGGTDVVSRHLLERLSINTQWVFIIDNRAGASGNLGLDGVAKSKPDGYTLGMGQTSNMAINPAAMLKMPFDPQTDLLPVALVAELPTVLVVKADSPYLSLGDVIKAASVKTVGAARISLALAGTGTVGHLAGEMLAKRAGLEFLNVPYKGATPAITDLLGGQTDCMFATPQAVMGLIAGGRLRVLASTSSKRVSSLQGVATVSELGYSGFEAVDWKVVVAPASTPPEVVRKLNAAVQKVLLDPAFIAQLAEEGSSPIGGEPAKVQAYIKAQQAAWAQSVKAAGLHFD